MALTLSNGVSEMPLKTEVQGHCVQGHPILDNSLTSLSWLQNLTVLDLVSPGVSNTIPISPTTDESWESLSTSSSPPDKQSSTRQEQPSSDTPLSPIRQCLMQSFEFNNAPRKYRSNSARPNHSYTTLIYLALQNSRSGKSTLTEIYKWIRLNFKYYRHADSSWEKSIRHNLSLNDLFVKAPQSNGKRGYWRINPDYTHTLMETSSTLLGGDTSAQLPRGSGRKRAQSASTCSKATQIRKRIKSESTYPADPCGLPGDLDWVSLLSSQRLSCGSCPSQSCRPSFGSPVLGSPDLGHIGEPVLCSPLNAHIPTTAMEPMDIPPSPLVGVSRGALLEETVLNQDSPPLQLLPWDESCPQSPFPRDSHFHPWAESREKTLHEMRNLTKRNKPLSASTKTTMWSPDSSWSSSSTYATTSFNFKKKGPLLSEACIY